MTINMQQTNQSSKPAEKPKKPPDQVVAEGLDAIENLDLPNESAKSVKLSLVVLLLMRGALHPSLFSGTRKFSPYPVLVKYIRASNAESLGGLVDEVLRSISPNFITLPSLGGGAQAIYAAKHEDSVKALALLQEETTPLVIMMKKIYQTARGYDEADEQQDDTGGSPQ